MRADLVELLQCPECGGTLAVVGANGGQGQRSEEIEEGALACRACSGRWPIVRGVPRMAGGIPEEVRETGARFGYEWTSYSELRPDYEEQFLAWIAPARREDFRGRTILDAGCGKGRHLALASEFGADRAVGIDVGLAVEAARANTRDRDGVDIVQADLRHLPLRARFDLIYCVGVLHHLPDPGEGLASLARHLAPGGRIHVWVYGHEGNAWIRLGFDPIRRLLLRRLPPTLLHPLAWIVTPPLVMVSRFYALLAHRAPGLHRRLFYRDYLTFLARMPLRVVRWIVFDQMVAPTTHYIRQEELAGWLRDAGLQEVRVETLRNMSWRGTARAPTHIEGEREGEATG